MQGRRHGYKYRRQGEIRIGVKLMLAWQDTEKREEEERADNCRISVEYAWKIKKRRERKAE